MRSLFFMWAWATYYDLMIHDCSWIWTWFLKSFASHIHLKQPTDTAACPWLYHFKCCKSINLCVRFLASTFASCCLPPPHHPAHLPYPTHCHVQKSFCNDSSKMLPGEEKSVYWQNQMEEACFSQRPGSVLFREHFMGKGYGSQHIAKLHSLEWKP